MLQFLVILSIIFYMVTLWKFAVKVGKPGWSLFIPIYSNFVWVDIARMDSIWCLLKYFASRRYSKHIFKIFIKLRF